MIILSMLCFLCGCINTPGQDKNKNRVAYAVVNGQTGKVVGTTPVSLLKVFIYGITKAGLTWALVEMISRLFGGLVS